MRCRNAFGTLTLVLVVVFSIGGNLAGVTSDITRTITFKTDYGAIPYTETFTIPAQTQYFTETSVTTVTATEPFFKSSSTLPLLASFLAALALMGIVGHQIGRRKNEPIRFDRRLLSQK